MDIPIYPDRYVVYEELHTKARVPFAGTRAALRSGAPVILRSE